MAYLATRSAPRRFQRLASFRFINAAGSVLTRREHEDWTLVDEGRFRPTGGEFQGKKVYRSDSSPWQKWSFPGICFRLPTDMPHGLKAQPSNSRRRKSDHPRPKYASKTAIQEHIWVIPMLFRPSNLRSVSTLNIPRNTDLKWNALACIEIRFRPLSRPRKWVHRVAPVSHRRANDAFPCHYRHPRPGSGISRRTPLSGSFRSTALLWQPPCPPSPLADPPGSPARYHRMHSLVGPVRGAVLPLRDGRIRVARVFPILIRHALPPHPVQLG